MVDDRCSVVIVDDAAEVRSLVRTQLNLSGLFVVVAEGSTGADAIELCRQHRPAIALLDISMPEVDGLDALPVIRESAPETKVVVYTGFEQSDLAARALQLGAAAVLEKSQALASLPTELEAIWRGTGATPGQAATDVAKTDRQLLEDYLERFREVFEQAAIGMATMTLTGRIGRANSALAQIVGRDIHELVGLPYTDIALPHNANSINEALRAAQQGSGTVVRFEHEAAADPDRRLLGSVAPVRDSGGRPLYLLVQTQDVSRQRRVEEQLDQSEQRFRLLVEAVQDYAIFMLDTGGHVVSWNAGAQRIKGYASAEIIGQHFRVFYPREVQEARHPEHELELALRHGHYEEEGWRIRKDATRFWASVVITAVRNPAGEHIGFAKVTRDIDERRQMLLDAQEAAAALAAANAELETANLRLEREAADQAQFLAVTAHELRNPIGVLAGSANLLVTHLAQLTDEDRQELTDSVNVSTARLQRLLRDLLMAARLEAKAVRLELGDVDISALIARTVAATRKTVPDADIVVQIPYGIRVRGEADRLAQAVENLISNALRHGKPPVVIDARTVGDSVEIVVSDSGPGVPADVQARLFERFAAGKPGTGTGLGLFIVRELARAHGGDARYDLTDEGKPSFVLALPSVGAAAPQHGDHDRSMP